MGFLSLFEFCHQDNSINQNGSILPASQQVLMRFCSHLADRLHHSSINVYLSGICSLHLDMGFSDPLSNCLQLQRVLCSINSYQDSTKAHASQSQGSLKKFSPLSYPKTTRTPCFGLPSALIFFGFSRGSEFIVNSSFGASIHPSFQDLSATGFHIQPHLSTCAHQNGPLSSRMLYLFQSWTFIYLTHCFYDGILPSTRSNTRSSLCSRRWSTPVLDAAVSFHSFNFICSWETRILLWPQLLNWGSNHGSSAGSSRSPH